MRIVVIAIGLVASVVLCPSAYADPYGSLDQFVSKWDKSTCGGLTLGDCEEAKLAELLGVTVDQVNLTQTEGDSGWVQAGTNYVAFDFLAYGIINPGYYAVKIGTEFFIFQNSPETQYALIDLSKLNVAKNGGVSIDSISHIATVPEPGSFSLLLSGLTVLGLVSVKRSRLLR